jgi:uncharacterized protein
MTLILDTQEYIICRLSPDTQAANIWLPLEGFWSLTRTEEETSLVMQAGNLLPNDAVVEGGWCLLRVAGKLDFSLVGVLARLTAVLAEAGVSVFAVSTYDTDYLLFKEHQRKQALQALKNAGYGIQNAAAAALNPL